jgi:hypothetical protein
MHWSDGLGGLLLMLAAMIAIVVFALPVMSAQRAVWGWSAVFALAAAGGGLVLYGRYWYVAPLLNRKEPRTPCRIPAQIVVAAALPPIQCTVVDISKRGAGLSVSDTSGLPKTFELVIEGDPTRRLCRVAWMRPEALGVEFQDFDSSAAAASAGPTGAW